MFEHIAAACDGGAREAIAKGFGVGHRQQFVLVDDEFRLGGVLVLGEFVRRLQQVFVFLSGHVDPLAVEPLEFEDLDLLGHHCLGEGGGVFALAECAEAGAEDRVDLLRAHPVSYTHLTLPTN